MNLDDFKEPADLLKRENLLEICEVKGSERAELIAQVELKAAEFKVKTALKRLINEMLAEEQAEEMRRAAIAENYDINGIKVKRDGNGKPITSIENFVEIMRQDEFFSGIRFNLLTYSPEWDGEKWDDTHDSTVRGYIEAKYKIHSREKCDDGFRMFLRTREYNPVIEEIESIKWDGVERIPTLLSKWLKCDDTPYTREVSRLIFSGGINRLYNPGCKFDDVPVLVGTKQGEGKSTFIRWLALKDEWFTDNLVEIEGTKGIEALEGIWICEIAEMMATTKAKEVESVKAYITRQNDRYRRPFDKRVTDHPRQCIFIGTTNKSQFLTDKTGNRRWYPVTCRQSGYDLFNNKEAIQSDIRQCWAEAKAKFDKGEMLPYADQSLIGLIRSEQDAAVEDDYRVGLIEDYIDGKSEVCALELWRKALNNEVLPMSKRDSMDIGLIMQGMTGWVKEKTPKRFAEYGLQRYWKNVSNIDNNLLDVDDLLSI